MPNNAISLMFDLLDLNLPEHKDAFIPNPNPWALMGTVGFDLGIHTLIHTLIWMINQS